MDGRGVLQVQRPVIHALFWLLSTTIAPLFCEQKQNQLVKKQTGTEYKRRWSISVMIITTTQAHTLKDKMQRTERSEKLQHILGEIGPGIVKDRLCRPCTGPTTLRKWESLQGLDRIAHYCKNGCWIWHY